MTVLRNPTSVLLGLVSCCLPCMYRAGQQQESQITVGCLAYFGDSGGLQ
jgi:hypothetical protein